MLTSDSLGAATARGNRYAASATESVAAATPVAPPRLDWRRYHRLGWFCLKSCLAILWWDLLLDRPILGWFRSPPAPRWRRLACEFRALASEMGGLLVKLAQFLSLRVDLLPRMVTEELAVLQDQMPPVATAAIVAAIEADVGSPVAQLFAWFAPHPVASASLAQVHQARLPSGEQVVVKVLRPGVVTQFEMDLAVIAQLFRYLNHMPRIRQALDLNLVLTEFTMVTRRELDMVSEGRHSERFAHDFADDPQVYTPKVYWQYSGAQTLTQENVGFLKVNQIDAIAATGIDPVRVAEQLAKVFLRQIFVTHFIHADPHPGNVFVKPLPHPAEDRALAFAPGAAVAHCPGRPFQLVLIDFGMASEIPPRAQQWLREFVIGLGTRDAKRIVQAYLAGGVLRPDADPARVEEMTAALLADFQELLVGLMPDREQARPFFAEFEDLVQHYPFQIPVDLLFMFRALGIVSGLVKTLDPDFDLTAAAAPFARQFLWQEWQEQWRSQLQAFSSLSRMLVTPPLQLDEVWSRAQELLPPQMLNALFAPTGPDQTLPTALGSRDRQLLRQLDQSVEHLSRTIVAVCLLIAGVVWHVGTKIVLAVAGTTGPPDHTGLLLIILALTVLLWRSQPRA